MSKHEGEKCGKLHITYILSSQRGITPSKIDAKWWHSNLICRTLKQSHVQNFSSICQSMHEKSAENGRTETRTESRTDCLRSPVWRRAYKKNKLMLVIYVCILNLYFPTSNSNVFILICDFSTLFWEVSIEHLQRVRLANKRRLLLRKTGPVPFGTYICSNVETIHSWMSCLRTFRVSNIPRYFYFASKHISPYKLL